MIRDLDPRWEMESIFSGGSESVQLAASLDQVEEEIGAFAGSVAALTVPQQPAQIEPVLVLLLTMQDLSVRLTEASAFLRCLSAADVKDQHARTVISRTQNLGAHLQAAATRLESLFLQLDEPVWAALLAHPRAMGLTFPLNERRERAREKLGPDLEALAGSLSVDGYHGWGDMYNTIIGRISIAVTEEGKEQRLSAGQLSARLSVGDRTRRAVLWEKWEGAWAEQAELIAGTLNHLAGFRINLYQHRGWESILKEPLANNRMQQATLQSMWDVISRNKSPLTAYMARKAALLGVERLCWHDLRAPLGQVESKVSYDAAANLIIAQFGQFSPDLADFAETAFRSRWIEVEDRPGKRPGGFCSSFPASGQSRIFMTFTGTKGGIATLAHELGHAYHQHVMLDMAPMARRYAMNVAETASTFAEMIVADALLKAATSREERLVLLADKIERAISFMMDIHARFIFEVNFYQRRRQGPLTVQQLNSLMVDAQMEAFEGALEQYHVHHWASKLHFHATGAPFYNFPYTFGYLFSAGLHARAMTEGPAFAGRYVALLRDTGSMPVEELGQKHLDVDLSGPDFWQEAVSLVLADVQEFLALTQ